MTLPSASRKYRLHMGCGYYSAGGGVNDENTPVVARRRRCARPARGGDRLLPAVRLRGEALDRREGSSCEGVRPRGRSAALGPMERVEPARSEDGPPLQRPALRPGREVELEER